MTWHKLSIVLLALAAPLWGARSFNGSSDYIEAGVPIRTATPLTISAWFRPDNVTAFLSIVATGSTTADASFRLAVRGDLSGDPFEVLTLSGGAAPTSTVGTVQAGVWQHGCGVWLHSTSRTAYLDGVPGTTSTLIASDPTASDRFEIGRRLHSGGGGGYFAGSIADVAVWNVGLTEVEVQALAKGLPPILVRPQSLIFWAPLLGPDARDLRDAVTLTTTGTAVTAHPRLYQPQGE